MDFLDYIKDKDYVKACQVKIEKDLYHIQILLIPINDGKKECEILISKKFDSIRDLYKILSKYHEKMHRPNPMPKLVKIQFFDRNPDFATLTERKVSVENFIQFCCENVHLYLHTNFVNFFEDCEIREIVEEIDLPKPTITNNNNNSVATNSNPPPLPSIIPLAENQTLSTEQSSISLVASEKDIATVRPPPQQPQPPTSSSSSSSQTNSSSKKSSYLESAHGYCQAAETMEIADDLEGALEMYKLSVGTLLKGAKNESDSQLRQLAHQLASDYLQRAENISSRQTASATTTETPPPPPPVNNSKT